MQARMSIRRRTATRRTRRRMRPHLRARGLRAAAPHRKSHSASTWTRPCRATPRAKCGTRCERCTSTRTSTPRKAGAISGRRRGRGGGGREEQRKRSRAKSSIFVFASFSSRHRNVDAYSTHARMQIDTRIRSSSETAHTNATIFTTGTLKIATRPGRSDARLVSQRPFSNFK
jgi:hypothetical protein